MHSDFDIENVMCEGCKAILEETVECDQSMLVRECSVCGQVLHLSKYPIPITNTMVEHADVVSFIEAFFVSEFGEEELTDEIKEELAQIALNLVMDIEGALKDENAIEN